MSDWISRALELGADAAQLIQPKQVVVAEWVRHKCQYGCGGYGQCLTCPPLSPGPEATHQMLRHYSQALLLRVDVAGGGYQGEDPQRLRLARAVAGLERELFLAGHHQAWGLSAGPCPFCETCNLDGPCRFPRLARPSLEACGIDVYSTVRQAGWQIQVVQTPESCYHLFGLVLSA